jgi:hypothetical protein
LSSLPASSPPPRRSWCQNFAASFVIDAHSLLY